VYGIVIRAHSCHPVGDEVGDEVVGEPVGDEVGDEVVGEPVGDEVGDADVGEPVGDEVGDNLSNLTKPQQCVTDPSDVTGMALW
jgi:hypothetical protein